MKYILVLFSLTGIPFLKGATGSINLSTGLNAANAVIASGGAADGHWTDSSGPAQTVYPSSQDWGTNWLADGPDSTWLALNAGTINNGPAPYSFTRTFDLTGYNLATVSLTGGFAADDTGTLSLNGHPLASAPFGTWNALTPIGPVPSSYFVAGLNTLTITVTTSDENSEGVRFEGSVSGSLLALRFVPVTPCRVADTRGATGAFGGPIVTGQTTRSFAIPQSACGIPATAQAYALNVTVAPGGVLGYLAIWPSGVPQPLVSTLNSDGRVKANAAIVAAGANGAVSVYASNDTQVVLDIDGYFVAAGDPTGLAFYPLTPCRVADTRLAAGPLGGPFIAAGQARAVPVQLSACGVPANARAYALNFTAVPKRNLNFLTIWPYGQAQPDVSTLNATSGAVVANAALVPAGAGGDIAAYATEDTDLVVDVNGYFGPAGSGGLSLYTLTPCRVLDTRVGLQPLQGMASVAVTSSNCGVPAAAQAYVLNATVAPSAPLGYLNLWPAGQPQPLSSTLNASDGAVTSNMAIVPGSGGAVDAYASSATGLILDVAGYFAP